MPFVQSSAVRRITWDDRTATLFVQFADGDLYAYLGVPRSVFEAFVAAPSHGAFFAAAVRDRYPFRRLREAG